MAGGMQQGANRFARGRRQRQGPVAEINVTPFVDVMLVLLVIFMVTAPLLTVGVPVDLPESEAQSLTEPDEPLVVSVDAEGLIYIQDTEVELENLIPRLIAITENKADTRIYIRGDRSIDYGRVMVVMGLVNRAGYTRVALISQQPGSEDAVIEQPAPE